MFSLIAKLTITDYLNYKDPKVRESYGVLSSAVCIFCNILLGFFKVLFGVFTSSIAIQTDGLNNFSDVASNLASLVAFKTSSKHPDNDHPYGHGRIEYVVGLCISLTIIIVGFFAFKESIEKIINPQTLYFSGAACVALIISIIVKLWMSYFNQDVAKKIDSGTLMAVSKDSLNDVFSTCAALLSLIISLFTDLPIDGCLGVLVSCVVLKAGFESFQDTLDPLLGKAPDQAFIREVEEYIMSFEQAKGIHDLMLHDYGPGSRYLTLHVEVDATSDIMEAHEAIDQIERNILEKYHILTTIHMDPIDFQDENLSLMREIVLSIVQKLNQSYTIHDFRMVSGLNHTNLIFDVLIPASDDINHVLLKQQITTKLHESGYAYYTVIQVDHSFI